MIKTNRILFLVLIACFLFSCFSYAQDNIGNWPEAIIRQHKAIFVYPPKRIPAVHSVDAPLLGNGFTGVAISGAPEKSQTLVDETAPVLAGHDNAA